MCCRYSKDIVVFRPTENNGITIFQCFNIYMPELYKIQNKMDERAY